MALYSGGGFRYSIAIHVFKEHACKQNNYTYPYMYLYP